MRKGAIGRMFTGANENRAKKAPNRQSGHPFACMVKCRKYIMLAGMVMVIREGQDEQCRGNKGCSVQG